jgi:hypothetical protein
MAPSVPVSGFNEVAEHFFGLVGYLAAAWASAMMSAKLIILPLLVVGLVFVFRGTRAYPTLCEWATFMGLM